jgi:hypothetical protein
MKTNLSRRPAANRFSRTVFKPVIPAIALLLVLGALLPGVSTRRAVAASLAESTHQPPVVCTQTLAVTEGPFYTPGTPERTNLVETGMVGARVSVVGYVYDTNCQPVPNAWLDFWQANYYGVYDNTGYTLRGHQYADQTGYFHLETIVPGEYTGRTIHMHVKVQAPGGPILTTQLFFPDVAHNSIDNIFDPSLVVGLEHTQNGKIATYNFVVSQPSQSPKPVNGESYTFKETGFVVSGRFWDVWQGGRSFQDSIYINGYPITLLRDEVSPVDGKVYSTQWFERARYELHPENQAPNDVLLGLLGLPAVQGRESEAPFKPINNPGSRLQWFAQTGHTVGNNSTGGLAIAAYWSQRGNVRQFGLPLSQPFMETNKDNGKTYLVQYFERQRFEYHPEYKGTRYEILLGRLGSEQVGR